MPAGSTTTWITIALIVLVVVRFLVRDLRDRRLPLSRLWIAPGIVCAVALFLFYSTVQLAAGLLPELVIGSLAGIAAGAAIGFAVDRYTALRLSSDGTAIIVRGSMITVGIWVGALLLRLAGRFATMQFSERSAGMSMVLNTAFVFVIAAALVMLRWRHMLRVRALQGAAVAA